MRYKTLEAFLERIETESEHQPEYMQAVSEVMESLWPFVQKNPEYADLSLLERIIMPERIIICRVPWVDDKGEVQVDRGYRVQHSSAIGPYKGGMRFHPSVNLSIMKFLAFEQTFKNALTLLPMGGGKGGSNFDPKGKSDGEIMRFCQTFMAEMFRHLGSDTDVPAGDIGVGAREIGFMAGMMKKLSNKTDSVFTGKGLAYGGSLIRPEATGYGVVYFAQEMLLQRGREFDGLRVSVSGSGNVAQYAIERATSLGAKVVTVSDSGGTVIDERGFTTERIAELLRIKNVEYGRISEYARRVGATYYPGIRPWDVAVDLAIPCATENEISESDAATLVKNGVIAVCEGSNMATTIEATKVFEHNNVLFAPGKASNAGGVATSGMEMSQNAMRISWSREEVDSRLHEVMHKIHEQCLLHGRRDDGTVSYLHGANISGFIKVADAMRAQGIV